MGNPLQLSCFSSNMVAVLAKLKGAVLVLCLFSVVLFATLLIPPPLVFFPFYYPLYRSLNDWSVAQCFRLIPVSSSIVNKRGLSMMTAAYATDSIYT